jgi:hypothetical protein
MFLRRKSLINLFHVFLNAYFGVVQLLLDTTPDTTESNERRILNLGVPKTKNAYSMIAKKEKEMQSPHYIRLHQREKKRVCLGLIYVTSKLMSSIVCGPRLFCLFVFFVLCPRSIEKNKPRPLVTGLVPVPCRYFWALTLLLGLSVSSLATVVFYSSPYLLYVTPQKKKPAVCQSQGQTRTSSLLV